MLSGSAHARFRKIITDELKHISENDLDGALPYFMLTSKSESVVRDLLAVRLHRRLLRMKGGNSKYAVAREWSFSKRQKESGRGRRVDIAILALSGRGSERAFKKPRAIIEIKMVAAPSQVFSHDKVKGGVQGAVQSLRRQLKSVGQDGLKRFGLLVVRTCPKISDEVTKAFDEIILSRKRMLKGPSASEIKSMVDRLARKDFSIDESNVLSLGKDEYIPASVDLHWWLLHLVN